jgi:hypothetical protein
MNNTYGPLADISQTDVANPYADALRSPDQKELARIADRKIRATTEAEARALARERAKAEALAKRRANAEVATRVLERAEAEAAAACERRDDARADDRKSRDSGGPRTGSPRRDEAIGTARDDDVDEAVIADTPPDITRRELSFASDHGFHIRDLAQGAACVSCSGFDFMGANMYCIFPFSQFLDSSLVKSWGKPL